MKIRSIATYASSLLAKASSALSFASDLLAPDEPEPKVPEDHPEGQTSEGVKTLRAALEVSAARAGSQWYDLTPSQIYMTPAEPQTPGLDPHVLKVLFAGAGVKPPPEEIICGSLAEMFRAISVHTRTTGDVITSCDDVPRKLIGFNAHDKDGVLVRRWCLGITKLVGSGGTLYMPPDARETISAALRSASGRKALAEAFPGQRGGKESELTWLITGETPPRAYAKDFSEQGYKDLGKLFDDMTSHVRRTGDVIESSDDPKRRLIGWRAVGESGEVTRWWTIGLVSVKERSFGWTRGVRGDEPGETVIARLLMAVEGRKRLAAAVPGQRGLSPSDLAKYVSRDLWWDTRAV